MSDTSSTRGGMSLAAKFGYGAGEFSSAIFWVTIAFWLMNYLTDVLGLSAALAGLAVLLGKGIDAFVDPGVGFLSDKTRSRWGRRRPWFLFGAIPFGLAFILMFAKPGFAGQGGLFVWSCLAFILLNVAYSCVNVPYNSLLPELSDNYDERSSITGVKSVYSIVGALLGAGAAMPVINAAGGGAGGFLAMGVLFGILAAVGVLIPFFATRERQPASAAGAMPEPAAPARATSAAAAPSIVRSNKAALSNRPFRLILGVWTLNTCGITVVTTTLVYYFKYVFGNANLITLASLIMMLGAMAFVPIVVRISKSIGKRTTYAIGMSIVTLACLLMFFFGQRTGIVGVYVLMLAAGMGLSTNYVMPWAIVPDTIDYDYAESGVKREGVYYGLWTFMIKIGQALAAAFVGVALNLAGYVPDIAQGATALFGIRFLVGPAAALFFVIAIVLLALYPIDKKAYEEIRAKIDRRESKAAAGAP